MCLQQRSLCVGKKFKNDGQKAFKVFTGKKGFCKKYKLSSPLTLSLDVIYHLLEDNVFESYLSELFESSQKFVIIYSSNKKGEITSHVRHRKFTDYVSQNFPQFKLIDEIPNEYPEEKNMDEQSFADFYIYELQQCDNKYN